MTADLQVRNELAEDTIGAYISKVSALLSRPRARNTARVDLAQLAADAWLKGELFIAVADRARLFERDIEGLNVVIHLYQSRIAALSSILEKNQGLLPRVDAQSLSLVPDEIAKQNG